MLPNMNIQPHHQQQYQQQQHAQPSAFLSAPQAPTPTTDTAWSGDEMLHLYLCDYLRKRGYNQAAHLLHLEAGLDPTRPVPIDAPQSLLFEWWVVFWDFFTARTSPTDTQSAAPTTGASAGRRKSFATPAGALPQLDLEASQKLGLTRPTSRVVIQQCTDMMSLGGKNVDGLTEAQRREVGKRVSRLQNAQGDAQMRLAQLYGLQPPKALLNTHGLQVAGMKRKQSPNGDAERNAGGAPQQFGPLPMARRLSQSVQSNAPNAPSPLSNMVYQQSSPHSTMPNQSPASTAPTPGPVGYPVNLHARRPSVLAPDPNLQIRSPHQALAVHPSGLPTAPPPSSLSPATEWPKSTQYALQLQQAQPGQISQAIPPQQQRLQMSMPPTKPSVSAPVGFADGSYGGVNANGGLGGGDTGDGVVTPFADLEHDFNVLLSNSTQLSGLDGGKAPFG